MKKAKHWLMISTIYLKPITSSFTYSLILISYFWPAELTVIFIITRLKIYESFSSFSAVHNPTEHCDILLDKQWQSTLYFCRLYIQINYLSQCDEQQQNLWITTTDNNNYHPGWQFNRSSYKVTTFSTVCSYWKTKQHSCSGQKPAWRCKQNYVFVWKDRHIINTFF